MIVDTSTLTGAVQNRAACRKLIYLSLMLLELLFVPGCKARGQSPANAVNREHGFAGASSYALAWQQHFQIQTGSLPWGTAEDDGTLWLVTYKEGQEYLTSLTPEGRLAGTYNLRRIPLRPMEWIGWLSLATSNHSTGLLASLTSGGQVQTFEGAFFVPVGRDGPGTPRRVAGQGTQWPTLIAAGLGEFLAAGDQEPLTLLKLDSKGNVLWRRSFSRRLVLPEVAVGADRKILMASQGGRYLQLQLLDDSGRALASGRIAARQGVVEPDSDGGWTLLVSKGWGGKDNKVYLTRLDSRLRQLSQVETPLCGLHGLSYQLISTPHGHVMLGESPDGQQREIVAEYERSGRLLWQQGISVPFVPRLLTFSSGFYIVNVDFPGGGVDIEKYLF